MMKSLSLLLFFSSFGWAESPDYSCVKELIPLLGDLEKVKSPREGSVKMEKFLEKALEVGSQSLKKSGVSIPDSKLQEWLVTCHDHMEDMVDDLYLPSNID